MRPRFQTGQCCLLMCLWPRICCLKSKCMWGSLRPSGIMNTRRITGSRSSTGCTACSGSARARVLVIATNGCIFSVIIEVLRLLCSTILILSKSMLIECSLRHQVSSTRLQLREVRVVFIKLMVQTLHPDRHPQSSLTDYRCLCLPNHQIVGFPYLQAIAIYLPM